MPRRARRPATGHTILVVDDREEALISLRALLEHEGHRIITAQSGEDALALFREHAVDLVVVDYLMPRMTGAEFIREVRRQDPLVRIILHTGYAGDSIARVLDELRVLGYHDKSDGPEELLTAIRNALSPTRSTDAPPHRDHRCDAGSLGSAPQRAGALRRDDAGHLPCLDTAVAHPRPVDSAPSRRPRPAAEHIDDVLLHATIDAGILELDPQWVGIRDLAQRVCQLASRMLRDTGVRFVLDLGDDVPTIVFTDRERLLTVLRDTLFAAMQAESREDLCVRIAPHGGGLRFAVLTAPSGVLRSPSLPGRESDAVGKPQDPDARLGPAQRLARLLGGALVVLGPADGGPGYSLTIPVTDQGPLPHPDLLPPPARRRGRRPALG